MARVVVVHGIGQEFLGPEMMARDAGPALRDGVRLAGGPRMEPQDVACAFFGNVYFEEGTRSLDLPPWDETDVEEQLEATRHRCRGVSAVLPSSPSDIRALGSWSYEADRALTGNACRFGVRRPTVRGRGPTGEME